MLNNTGSMDPFFVKMEHHQNVKGGGGGGARYYIWFVSSCTYISFKGAVYTVNFDI